MPKSDDSPRFYYKQNRLKQLRAFCYAARAGSISKAAERLFLSQPSVSLQVRALEREMNTVLFERRGPSIRLTPAGEVLYDMSAALVEGMDRLVDDFAQRQGSVETGQLTIAAGESTILYILPRFVEQFAQRYPGVTLKLHNVTGRDGLAQLRADQADFAVGAMLEPQDDIDFYPVFTYDPVLITPIDHPLLEYSPLLLEQISPYGLILPPRHLSTWSMVDLVFQQYDVEYRVALEAGGWEVIKKYVAMGLGISIVTNVCLTGDERLAVLPLDRYFPRRTYGVVLRHGKFLSAAAMRFIALMSPGLAISQPGLSAGRTAAGARTRTT